VRSLPACPEWRVVVRARAAGGRQLKRLLLRRNNR